MMEKNFQEIGSDLVCVKNELQRAYSAMNQKELELERLQQQYENAKLDAENRYVGYLNCLITKDTFQLQLHPW